MKKKKKRRPFDLDAALSTVTLEDNSALPEKEEQTANDTGTHEDAGGIEDDFDLDLDFSKTKKKKKKKKDIDELVAEEEKEKPEEKENGK